MNSIFRKGDGRSVVVALDHGGIAGPVPGIGNPASVVADCVAGGADAVLATRGVVRAAAAEWDRSTAIIMRLTGGFTVIGGGFEEELISSPEAAIANGAAAVGITVKFGHRREGDFIRQASLAIDRCERLGLPVMIEAMAIRDGKNLRDGESIALAARAAQELGADFVKTHYTGDPESFSRVVAGCPVPILILGGERSDSPESLFSEVYDSLLAGGAGIAIGRGIWQWGQSSEGQTRGQSRTTWEGQSSRGQSRSMVEAMVGIVHGGWTVARALDHIRPAS